MRTQLRGTINQEKRCAISLAATPVPHPISKTLNPSFSGNASTISESRLEIFCISIIYSAPTNFVISSSTVLISKLPTFRPGCFEIIDFASSILFASIIKYPPIYSSLAVRISILIHHFLMKFLRRLSLLLNLFRLKICFHFHRLNEMIFIMAYNEQGLPMAGGS